MFKFGSVACSQMQYMAYLKSNIFRNIKRSTLLAFITILLKNGNMFARTGSEIAAAIHIHHVHVLTPYFIKNYIAETLGGQSKFNAPPPPPS